jgi:hypothetical protein
VAETERKKRENRRGRPTPRENIKERMEVRKIE